MSSSAVSKADIRHLYRRLLRACETYPSKNRVKIYESIQEDFRENMNLDPASETAKQQIHVAYKGLGQLHQYDNRTSSTFAVNLEQNPFPKPEGLADKRQERVDRMLRESEKDTS